MADGHEVGMGTESTVDDVAITDIEGDDDADIVLVNPRELSVVENAVDRRPDH